MATEHLLKNKIRWSNSPAKPQKEKLSEFTKTLTSIMDKKDKEVYEKGMEEGYEYTKPILSGHFGINEAKTADSGGFIFSTGEIDFGAVNKKAVDIKDNDVDIFFGSVDLEPVVDSVYNPSAVKKDRWSNDYLRKLAGLPEAKDEPTKPIISKEDAEKILAEYSEIEKAHNAWESAKTTPIASKSYLERVQEEIRQKRVPRVRIYEDDSGSVHNSFFWVDEAEDIKTRKQSHASLAPVEEQPRKTLGSKFDITMDMHKDDPQNP